MGRTTLLLWKAGFYDKYGGRAGPLLDTSLIAKFRFSLCSVDTRRIASTSYTVSVVISRKIIFLICRNYFHSSDPVLKAEKSGTFGIGGSVQWAQAGRWGVHTDGSCCFHWFGVAGAPNVCYQALLSNSRFLMVPISIALMFLYHTLICLMCSFVWDVSILCCDV